MEELEPLVLEAGRNATRVPCGTAGDLYAWSGSNGESLWIQVSGGSLIGATPFFSAGKIHSVRIEGAKADAGNPLEGQATLYLLPDESAPLPVDIVNWPVASFFLRPQEVIEMRLAAFSETAMVFRDEADYVERSGLDRPLSVPGVLPTGLYPEGKGGTGRSSALLVGRVQSSENLINELSGQPFRHVVLDALGAPIDVVMPADSPPTPPDSVLQTHCWLCGCVELPA